MAYGVVRTDILSGTKNPEDLVSIKYMGSGTTETQIENGNVVVDSGLVTGEREVLKGTTPAKDSGIDSIVLIATVEVDPDERVKNLDQFVNKAGKICRGYRLGKKNQVFAVTKDALDGLETPIVGSIVELKAGIKLNVAASLTSGATKVGEIIDVETVGKYTYYVIKRV